MPDSIEWNFKLLAHHELTASAAWARACRSRSPRTAGASSGSRMRARRRISPPSTCPIRASRRSWCRPSCRRATCARTRSRWSATSWRSPTRCQQPGQKPAGFELFDISVPEKPKSIAFVDRSGEKSRGVHQLWFCDGEYVHMAVGRGRTSCTHNQLDDQCYQHLRRAQSVEARRRSGAGGCPARASATAEPPPVAPQAADARHGLPRAQHQRLSAAPGPLLSRLHRRRHVRARHLRQGEPEAARAAGTTRRRITASPTRCCRCSSATCSS